MFLLWVTTCKILTIGGKQFLNIMYSANVIAEWQIQQNSFNLKKQPTNWEHIMS